LPLWDVNPSLLVRESQMKERILPILVVLLAVAVVVLGVALLTLINLFNTSVRTPSLSTTDTSTDNIQVSTEFPTPIITATITPGGPPTPTPINIETLPTPQPGAANVFGRVLCNGIPFKQHSILLVILEGDSRLITAGIFTDVNGRWLVENAPPGTYTIMNKNPAEFGDTLLGTWEVPPNQITDFRDVDFAPVGCEP